MLVTSSGIAFSQVPHPKGGTKVDSTGMVTLHIDPDNARGIPVSRIFEDVKFIPLETTKESLFGRIDILKIIKGQFVIFDSDTKAFLIFGPDGKFKAKIDAAKFSRNETGNVATDIFDPISFGKTDVSGFQAYEEKGDTLLQVFTRKYYYYFDLAGKQIRTEPRKEAPLGHTYLSFAGNAGAIRKRNFVKKNGTDSTYYETEIITNTKDTLGYFPFPFSQRRETLGTLHYHNFDAGDKVYFNRYYDYNLYKATPGKVSLAYRILFPAGNSLPVDFMTYALKDKQTYWNKNRNLFIGIKHFLISGDKVFLQMENFGYVAGFGPKTAFIYNLKTDEAIAMQDIEPDRLSSFLPVTDAGTGYSFFKSGFDLFKDGYLYTNQASLTMFSYKEQLGGKHDDTFSPAIQAYFKTQNKRSNPVIVRLKLKRN